MLGYLASTAQRAYLATCVCKATPLEYTTRQVAHDIRFRSLRRATYWRRPSVRWWRRRLGDGVDTSGSEHASTGGGSDLLAATCGYPDARTCVVRVCIGQVGDGTVGQCANISVVEARVRYVEGGPAGRHVRRQSMSSEHASSVACVGCVSQESVQVRVGH